MFQDFQKFVMRGNVLDLAVGVIIGGAFGKIVSSLVKDVLMPPIGLLLGGIDFGAWTIPLTSAPDGAAILIGSFVNNVIDFVIIAFVIFLIIRAANSFEEKEAKKEEAPKAPPADVQLLTEIRDLLKERPS